MRPGKPNWWDNFIAWYFERRWKRHFQADVRLLAVHIASLEKMRFPSWTTREEQDEYYEER